MQGHDRMVEYVSSSVSAVSDTKHAVRYKFDNLVVAYLYILFKIFVLS